MIFDVNFGDMKLKVGYFDINTLKIIAEYNNIYFRAVFDSSEESKGHEQLYDKENPLIY